MPSEPEPQSETTSEGLNADLAAFLALAAASATDTRPWHELTPAEARERCLSEIVLTTGGGEQSVVASDQAIATSDGRQVPIRIYHPAHSPSQPQLPAVVFVHGGGFVMGDLDTHDAICRDLVAIGGFVCIALAYRLSPEHPYPGALEDCVELLGWLWNHTEELGVDPSRVTLAGDSAGGNLAVATSLFLRDRGLALPSFQLLVYPALDLTMSTESARAFGPEYGLSTEDLEWFYSSYLGGADRSDPYASPYSASDLSGLPPTHIVSVGFDPLLDEGVNFATSLRGAGVATSSRHYPGLIHGALELGAVVPACRMLLEDVARRLAEG